MAVAYGYDGVRFGLLPGRDVGGHHVSFRI